MIIGVWIYNDIILRPIFIKMFPRLTTGDAPHAGETKNGENYEDSHELPDPTNTISAGKTKEDGLSNDFLNILGETRMKKNSVCGVGH